MISNGPAFERNDERRNALLHGATELPLPLGTIDRLMHESGTMDRRCYRRLVAGIFCALLLATICATSIVVHSISALSAAVFVAVTATVSTLFCLLAIGRLGTLRSAPVLLVLGGLAGFLLAGLLNDYKPGPVGALMGIVVAELVWVMIAVFRERRTNSEAVAKSSPARVPLDERKMPARRGSEPLRYLFIAGCVCVLGPLISTVLWGAFMLLDETVIFAKDGMYYLKAFSAIGGIVGVLVALPFAVAAVLALRSRQ